MRRLAFILALLLFASCRTASGPPASRPDLRAKYRIHRVTSGETLSAIARKYDRDVDDIADLNELTDPNRLAVGQELLIPGLDPRPEDLPKPPRVARPDLGVPTEASHKECAEAPKELDEDRPTSAAGYSWPVDGVVITKFGKALGLPQLGLDIAAPEGTPVRVAADGEVLWVGHQIGFGNLVIVRHDEGRVTLYAHQLANCAAVGDKLERGALVGLVGKSGGFESPYLYFELRVDGRPHNPRAVLP